MAWKTAEIKQELIERFKSAPAWEPPAASAGDDWPEPDLSILSHQRLDPPALPLNVFGPYWSQWISDQAEAKSCAPDYVAGGLISGAGVLLGNACWGSPWEGWAEPPIVWVAVVGNPSSGKSPGLDTIRDQIGLIEAEANKAHTDELAGWDTKKRLAKIRLEVWEDACKKARKEKKPEPSRPTDADEPPRPVRKRILTNDPTIEKLARIVVENPKGLLLFRDELAGWIGALDKYGGAGGDRAFYLEGFGGRAYSVDRIKDPQPIFIPALSIWLMGGIQPDRMSSLIFSGDDDGLAARFIYVWPERIPPRRPTRIPPSGAKAKLTKLYEIEERRDGDGNRVLLRFEPEAAAAIQDYRAQVAEAEAEASSLYLSWLGKLPGMAVRIAIILEHLYWCGDDEESKQSPASISERATVASIALLDRYAAPMAHRCFGDAALPQVDRDAIALAKGIKASLAKDACSDSSDSSDSKITGANGPNVPGTRTINARDLRRDRALPGKADRTRYEAALAELEAAGWLRPHPRRAGDKAGQQRKDWLLNPKLCVTE